MYHSPRDRARTAARLARLLLLGAAVAACGGGDTGRAAQDGASAPARAEAAGPSQARLSEANCPPPPQIDPTFFTDSSWASMVTWLDGKHAQFVAGGRPATRRVPLQSSTSAPVLLSIASEHRTHCLRRDSVTAVVRLTGMIRVDSATRAWDHDFARGDSILLFARGMEAFLVYDQGGRVRTAPPGAWKFFYCPDTLPHPVPASEWRDWKPGPPDDDDGEDPGTYGWMSCANGCCQFYIPPGPGEEEGGGRGGRRGATPCVPGH